MFYYPHATDGQRHLVIARMAQMAKESKVPQQYWDLKELLEGKEFFRVTTNQDQLFRRTFGDEKTAWIQGDWGWLQCGRPCHDGLCRISEFARRALADARDCAIPDADIPRCPRCGAPMSPWVRSLEFLEGSMYREQYRKYNGFLESHLSDNVLFLELGGGGHDAHVHKGAVLELRLPVARRRPLRPHNAQPCRRAQRDKGQVARL